MKNGIYNASIVTVRPELQPLDPVGEDVAGPTGFPADAEQGYAEWLADRERNDLAEAEFADDLEAYLATDLGSFE